MKQVAEKLRGVANRIDAAKRYTKPLELVNKKSFFTTLPLTMVKRQFWKLLKTKKGGPVFWDMKEDRDTGEWFLHPVANFNPYRGDPIEVPGIHRKKMLRLFNIAAERDDLQFSVTQTERGFLFEAVATKDMKRAYKR